MPRTLAQTESIGLARSAERVAEFGLLNGSEIIILAIKPSLFYVLLASWRWLVVLLPATVLACVLARLGTLGSHGQLLLVICLAGLCIWLAIGLLQWQSRIYILTNFRVLRIRGVLHVEMLQCPLLQVKEVLLTISLAEKLLGLGTLELSGCSADVPRTHWQNIRHPEQVRRQILQAISSLKGRSGDSSAEGLPPATLLPAAQSQSY